MKVFHLSYADQRKIPGLQKRYKEYGLALQQVYKIPRGGVPPASENKALRKASKETISIRISVKRFVGTDCVRFPTLVVTKTRTHFFSQEIYTTQLGVIDLKTPPYAPITIAMSFDKFRRYRGDPRKVLDIALNGNIWKHPNQPLNQLKFIIANTSPEGYEQLFDFGRGVQLLINIEYVVEGERKWTREEQCRFHIVTIKQMLEARLDAFSRSRLRNTGHHKDGWKYRISHERPFIDPISEDMFWRSPHKHMDPSELFTDTPSKFRRFSTVKFIEMQTFFQSSDQLEKVCLCSEWCNWNAFFHFNPIYRFLMVRHSQLFMTRTIHFPEMYLCISILFGCASPFPRTPVLQLMNNANDNRLKCLYNYIRKNPNYEIQYRVSLPDPYEMNAVAYNKLRYDMDIQRLCHDLDANPFSDFCIENLLNYYKVLSDLHVFHAQNRTFVYPHMKNEWFLELELLGLYKYKEFVKYGYELSMRRKLLEFDYLFTEDYDNSSHVFRTADEKMIKNRRDQILRRNVCAFNVKIRSER